MFLVDATGMSSPFRLCAIKTRKKTYPFALIGRSLHYQEDDGGHIKSGVISQKQTWHQGHIKLVTHTVKVYLRGINGFVKLPLPLRAYRGERYQTSLVSTALSLLQFHLHDRRHRNGHITSHTFPPSHPWEELSLIPSLPPPPPLPPSIPLSLQLCGPYQFTLGMGGASTMQSPEQWFSCSPSWQNRFSILS